MKIQTMVTTIAMLVAVTAICVPSIAQTTAQHHHYKLIDFGTFGGPQSYTVDTALFSTGLELNNRGTFLAYADTTTPDPTPPLCFVVDCLVAYGYQWKDGVISNLPPLRHGWSSAPVAVSENGLIAGFAENGKIDPLTGTAELRAVLWQNGTITNLGTLPGGGYESAALTVNDAGQVAGSALNTVPDSTPLFLSAVYPMAMQTTQSRAFFWDGGAMQDLGTLGGTDALAARINERGQVMGLSYTGATPGGCSPAMGSFIWDQEKGMQNLGGFGGTCTQAMGLNNRGQVAGFASLPGDVNSRAFLWQDGVMQDLGGSIGGGIATFAFALNETGEAVGGGELGGDSASYYHAALWTGVGQITDLGTLGKDPCSSATDINSQGQVVGGSISQYQCSHENLYTRAFLWENGSIVDLNDLIPPHSPLYLLYADHINDRGEIAGDGVDSSHNNHAFLLIPCDENHPNLKDCDYSLVSPTAASETDPRDAISSSRATRKQAFSNLDESVRGYVVRGNCSVNEISGTLTGSCDGLVTFAHSCVGRPETFACPAGKKAEEAEYTTCGRVDIERSCQFALE